MAPVIDNAHRLYRCPRVTTMYFLLPSVIYIFARHMSGGSRRIEAVRRLRNIFPSIAKHFSLSLLSLFGHVRRAPIRIDKYVDI